MSVARTPLKSLTRTINSLAPMVRVVGFDGSCSGANDAPVTVRVNDPAALLQLVRAPNGLGLARAWVTGQIDVEGDLRIFAGYESRLRSLRLKLDILRAVVNLLPLMNLDIVRRTGPTDIEYRRRHTGRHSVVSDGVEINHHYSQLPDFFQRVVGPSMAYSCGIFPSEDATLEEAQENKHQIIARKLGLDKESVLLDIGCGWGGFVRYVADHIGCEIVGVTSSEGQYDFLTKEFGQDTISFEKADYRKATPKPGITAVSSVGMYEHVGKAQSREYFGRLRDTLPLAGLFLNQSIVRNAGATRFQRPSFIQRYIFPNGEVLPLSSQLQDAEAERLSVISIEMFGSHYARTLRAWRSNLEEQWDSCRALVGDQTVRAWRMYLLGSESRFEDGTLDLAQVLFTRAV